MLPIINDINQAVDNDEWMWIADWGVQRGGKTTVAFQAAYELYKDWDDVLACLVFTLPDLIKKNKEGIPRKFPTRQGFNSRVPIRIYDDMAADANKAVRKYNIAYDELKAYFQVMGTKVAVLIGTMAHPFDITQQLFWKFTHELWVYDRGKCKYDKAQWQQNYSGWVPKTDKQWIHDFDFDPMPEDVYKEYNEMRMSLADEVEVRIIDKLASTQLDYVLKRLNEKDIEFLKIVKDNAPITREELMTRFPDYHESLIKLRARYLVNSQKKPGTSHSYAHEVTDFGLEVLATLEKQGSDAKNV